MTLFCLIFKATSNFFPALVSYAKALPSLSNPGDPRSIHRTVVLGRSDHHFDSYNSPKAHVWTESPEESECNCSSENSLPFPSSLSPQEFSYPPVSKCSAYYEAGENERTLAYTLAAGDLSCVYGGA